jgi:periplasmic protein TonB
MAVAGTAASLWRQQPARPGAPWIGAAVALGLHGLLAASIVGIDPARFHSDTPIVIEIQEPPPPDIKPPPPEPPPPPPEPRVRPLARRVPTSEPASPPPAPPPPNQETPPKTEEAPPVFGGTLSSVVSGGSSEVAVPIGNSLMTKPGTGPRTGEVSPYGSDGTRPFTPVADIYIAKYPELLFAPDSPDEIYPPEAKRMGIEGIVRFKLGIDEKGNVVRVKIVERAGHGFDERATRAMWRAKFKPAIGSDGRPVPCTHIWGYRFELQQ